MTLESREEGGANASENPTVGHRVSTGGRPPKTPCHSRVRDTKSRPSRLPSPPADPSPKEKDRRTAQMCRSHQRGKRSTSSNSRHKSSRTQTFGPRRRSHSSCGRAATVVRGTASPASLWISHFRGKAWRRAPRSCGALACARLASYVPPSPRLASHSNRGSLTRQAQTPCEQCLSGRLNHTTAVKSAC